MFKKLNNVLIFASHHDDETIACGGTIKKLSDQGVKITVIFGTDGATGVDHTRTYEKQIISTRAKEAEQVGKILGINKIINWSIPCQQLNYNSELMQRAVKLVRELKPELIITHSKDEKHSDHKALCEIVTQAAWKSSEDILPELGKPHRVQDVWCFEVVDVIHNIDYCIDITEQMNCKIQAMKVYESQENVVSGIISFIKGLGMVRGYSIGVEYAEAFRRIALQPVSV